MIAAKAEDLTGALIATGAMAHMMIQIILNIAVVTNSIPNTGITLPFISYGGTSVVFLLLEMGLVLSVSGYSGRNQILILTVAVLVVICIFGFRTRKIQVSGNVYYGEGTITNWIEKDPLSVNSLYLLGKYTFDKGELPSGVESLKVSLKNPWTVAVTVVEKSMLGYVDYDEAMLYFDEQGIATLRSAKQIEGVPYMEGLSFDTAEVEIGKVLPVEDDTIFEKLAETSRYLRKNALSPERIVCNTDGSDVVLYFGAVEVLLGNEKYEERLAQVGPILEELKKKYPDTAGTLHLENFDSSSASIRFTPQTAEQTADVQ